MGNPKALALQVGEKKLWLKSTISAGKFGQMYIAESNESGSKEFFAVRITTVPLDDRGRVTRPEVSVWEEAGIVVEVWWVR